MVTAGVGLRQGRDNTAKRTKDFIGRERSKKEGGGRDFVGDRVQVFFEEKQREAEERQY